MEELQNQPFQTVHTPEELSIGTRKAFRNDVVKNSRGVGARAIYGRVTGLLRGINDNGTELK